MTSFCLSMKSFLSRAVSPSQPNTWRDIMVKVGSDMITIKSGIWTEGKALRLDNYTPTCQAYILIILFSLIISWQCNGFSRGHSGQSKRISLTASRTASAWDPTRTTQAICPQFRKRRRRSRKRRSHGSAAGLAQGRQGRVQIDLVED